MAPEVLHRPPAQEEHEHAAPNILLITSDQHHYSALGTINPAHSEPLPWIVWPEGVQFDRAYCNNPVCSPSRSTMITGLYPAWHGCWTIGVKLPEDVPTVGRPVSGARLRSMLIGKAHFQPWPRRRAASRSSASPSCATWTSGAASTGRGTALTTSRRRRMHAHESHAGQHYACGWKKKGLTNWQDYFQKWPRDPDDKYRGPQYTRGATAWDIPEE